MIRFKNLGYIILGILMSGCFAKEEAIEPFPRGDVSVNTIAMGPIYADQFFYSLDKNEVVKTVAKTFWDLSFSSSPNDNTIRLNTGKNMYAAKTNETDLFAITDTSGLVFTWDWSNGKTDSLALFGWDEQDVVHVLNLGRDENNQPLGFVNVKFKLVNEDLEISYVRFGSRTAQSFTLKKDAAYNAVYFSFATNTQVLVEPTKNEYDLVFRQYIQYFAPEKLAYLVVGTLINPNQTRVAKIFDKPFNEITISDSITHPFRTTQDEIGYDWKEFKLSDGIYVVYAKQNYLIQDSKGFFYKLHFTDYYGKSGERGHPTLEFKRL